VKIVVDSLTDYMGDCEQCGGGTGAEGYRVHIDGEQAFELTPVDYCYDPKTYTELDLLSAILLHLGYQADVSQGEYLDLSEPSVYGGQP
jgi:hypothetical protein